MYAVKRRTLSLFDLAYRTAAYPARLAYPIVHEVALLKIAGLSIGADEVAQRTAALLDRRGEDFPDCQLQPDVALQADAPAGVFGWMRARNRLSDA